MGLILKIRVDASIVRERYEKGQPTIPVIIDKLIENYGAKASVAESDLMTCSLRLEASGDARVFEASARSLISAAFPELDGADKLEITVENDGGEQPAKSEPPAHDDAPTLERITPQSAPPVQEGAVQASALDSIEALIGAEEFKALARELALVAPHIKAQGTLNAFRYQNYMLAINSGYGLTTSLSLLSKLLNELGLCETDGEAREIRLKPPQPSKSNDEPLISQTGLNSIIPRRGRNKRALVCIDISDWMNSLETGEFRQFLRDISNLESSGVTVFRVPFLEQDVLLRVCDALNDVLLVRQVTFTPMDNEQLRAYAQDRLKAYGFDCGEGVWEHFDQRLREEKSDGRFYGLRTVDKVVADMVYLQHRRNAQPGANCGMNGKLITSEGMQTLCRNVVTHETGAEEMLNALVGMEDVKRRIYEIISQIEYAQQNSALRAPCMHMQFTGNPGTGKTTVARIVGKLLKERGLLRNGSFFEYNGRDLCGMYVGHTAPKTSGICRDAYGSVLFIDEAYSLYTSRSSDVDFGREALSTLIAEMENHRTDLVVILAGYTDDMAMLMHGNAGLASRIPYRIEFPNFTREELVNIFMRMAGADFECDAALRPTAEKYFREQLSEAMLTAKDFSNGRFVRNLYERTWGKAVTRTRLNKLDKLVISGEDLLGAIEDGEFSAMNTRQSIKTPIGFTTRGV